ncbi:A/G-specific adenine glycosylase [Undibacterium sp. FT79W]|uniref:A/G-specific adenine glycosylase n=1 Tax=Undibacterium sp. FT79W TaxID=2762296 RepID=UPI00164B9CA1|nr:A/G-specific adenine glycosylase [Undibacterium sp. FT79W]MBC3878171.1 A/G-specific adenine glycosylase [Undibacterium sp. FT79W]
MKRRIQAAAAANFIHPEFVDPDFSATVIRWQKQHGRHGLPWQQSREAYRVWLSEIMLQQTQVSAVIPYYQKFLQSFPTVFDLAAAPAEDVMAHWSGLGYYTRARNLHQCAKQVVEKYQGQFPADQALLEQLPGIGRSTAAAITAFSYGTVAAILDGNVKRVFARVFGIAGYPGTRVIEDSMWQRALALLPEEGIESYTQGLMDFGATLCTRSSPACGRCPLQARCVAFAEGRTAELPTRKPKKQVKEKRAVMLLLLDQNRVLLERRPDSGIWGGLLSLPEVDGMQEYIATEDDADDATVTFKVMTPALLALTARFGEVEIRRELPVIEHVFTHFKLHIHTVVAELTQHAPQVADANYVWLDLKQAADAGLPAPIKTLLNSLAQAELQL